MKTIPKDVLHQAYVKITEKGRRMGDVLAELSQSYDVPLGDLLNMYYDYEDEMHKKAREAAAAHWAVQMQMESSSVATNDAQTSTAQESPSESGESAKENNFVADFQPVVEQASLTNTKDPKNLDPKTVQLMWEMHDIIQNKRSIAAAAKELAAKYNLSEKYLAVRYSKMKNVYRLFDHPRP